MDASDLLDEWLSTRDVIVAAADRALFSRASDPEHRALAKKLLDNGIMGGSCLADMPGDRFPLTRTRRIDSEESASFDREIKKWLYECGIRFSAPVHVHYARTTIETTWKTFIRYWSLFWSGRLEDAIVVDRTMQWALAIHHSDWFVFHCYRNRPQNGRMNWDFVLRVHQGLTIYPESSSDES